MEFVSHLENWFPNKKMVNVDIIVKQKRSCGKIIESPVHQEVMEVAIRRLPSILLAIAHTKIRRFMKLGLQANRPVAKTISSRVHRFIPNMV